MILTEGDTIHAAPPEPVVPRAAVAAPVDDDEARGRRSICRARSPRRRRGRVGGSRAAEDRAGAEGGRRQPRPRRGDPAGQLQDARCAKLERIRPRARSARETLRSVTSEARTLLQRRAHLPPPSRRPRSPSRRSAVGSTKCSVPATTFLSCCIASRICAAEQIGDRRQRPEAGDQIGERLPIALGERAARDARAPRRRACRSRPLRRAGSAGTWSPLRARGRRCGRSSGSAAARLRARRPTTTSALMRHDSAMIGSQRLRCRARRSPCARARCDRTASRSTSCRT